MDGLLVIDKPAGPTSHDVVMRLRQVLRERRIGHTGTLDPAASGVLPLVLGRATRLAQFLTTADKTYEAAIRLGIDTDTYDAAGQVVGTPHHGPWPPRSAIEHALNEFRGSFLQMPPAYSAKHVEGRRSYKAARASARDPSVARPTAPPAVDVTTHAIELIDVDESFIRLSVACSAGFYVRSLAHDLGQRLGTGAHLEALRRTRSGDSAIEDALSLAVAERSPETARAAVVPLDRMLPHLAAVVLTDEGVRRAAHGRALDAAQVSRGLDRVATDTTPGDAPSSAVRLLGPNGALVGIARAKQGSGPLHPYVVLV
jgi:tRNA pseudouridine55 synthase